MIVNVQSGGSVSLLEAEDTRGFKLVVPRDLGDADLARALSGAADLVQGHAWVSQDWIRENSPLADSSEWQASFAKMVDYADGKGWLRDTDKAIRAHVERS